MPLFEPSPAELAAAQPMIVWLNTVEWVFRDYPKPGAPGGGIFSVATAASYPVGKPVLEALQLLEHAERVMYDHWFDQNYPQLAWLATRLGTSKLAEGRAAIRQRVAERTGL